jgi:S1-C subfamily serine protease
VNLLDGILVVAVLVAGYTGYRCGLAARALSWAGLALGIFIGVEFVNDIARALQGSTPRTRLLACLAFLVLVAIAGQSLGIALGSLVRKHLPWFGGIRLADRIAGGAVGVLGVLIIVWLLIPGLANVPGWPAQAVRGSAIVREIDQVAPAPPSTLASLGRLVGDTSFAEVFNDLTTNSNVGAPPGQGIPPPLAARVALSVVKVQGRACDVIQDGSGAVVANGIVVTNAHVVAGEASTTVITPGGSQLDATVVAFDPVRDVAVLHVPSLGVSSLPIVDAQIGATGGVFGYPGGGPETQSPAEVAQRIDAQGTDIYGNGPTHRDVLVLAAKLHPGNSGGPFIDDQGRVAGLAFAVDPAATSTAYALATDEIQVVLRPVVAAGGGSAVSTGNCING